jgi:NADH-quinone oxidoreductase subunit J
MIVETLFFLFGALALGAAINVLVQRHVLYSALSLIMMLASVSGLFVLLRAELLAVIQIVVYTGAIMVLFVFVIMLLNVASEEEEESGDPNRWLKFVGIPGGLFLLAMLSSSVWSVDIAQAAGAEQVGSTAEIGRSLFTSYLLPFEATSILILIAIVGALVLAKRDI